MPCSEDPSPRPPSSAGLAVIVSVPLPRPHVSGTGQSPSSYLLPPAYPGGQQTPKSPSCLCTICMMELSSALSILGLLQGEGRVKTKFLKTPTRPCMLRPGFPPTLSHPWLSTFHFP